MGTGVVAFNLAPKNAIFSDTNPHLINFYRAIQDNSITPSIVKSFLYSEGKKLETVGADYYYEVRERFNKNHDPLDFLFLNRACFNGMVRFNGKGGFNVPFCRKEKRFAQAYIKKISNQVNYVHRLFQHKSLDFICQPFEETIKAATSNDIIYCDPPYIGRHADYFNGWDEKNEIELNQALIATNAKFVFSICHSNNYRENEYIERLWSNYHLLTKDHYYHVGGKENNRNSMLEALVTNLPMPVNDEMKRVVREDVQINLLGAAE